MDLENHEITWEKILAEHWKSYSDELWRSFNHFVKQADDSNGKVSFEKWREYFLYDMQRRHNEEKQTEMP